MLTVNRHADGDAIRYTVTGGEETERFSTHLLAEADCTLLDFDIDTGDITITAENGVWRYRVARFDDDQTVVAHLIKHP